MTKHYLSPLFTPSSVAVFGASNRPGSVGRIVFENTLRSGFQGRLYDGKQVHDWNAEGDTLVGDTCQHIN